MLILKTIKDSWNEFKEKLDNGEYSAREIILGSTIIALIAVIVGIMVSPKNVNIGCDNGNSYFDGDNSDDDDEDYDDDEE